VKKSGKKMIVIVAMIVILFVAVSRIFFQERECSVELVYSYENLYDDTWEYVSQTGKNWIVIREYGFWTAEMLEKCYLAETGRALSEDYPLDTEHYTYIWCHGCRLEKLTYQKGRVSGAFTGTNPYYYGEAVLVKSDNPAEVNLYVTDKIAIENDPHSGT
jgi:hypothetical protein